MLYTRYEAPRLRAAGAALPEQSEPEAAAVTTAVLLHGVLFGMESLCTAQDVSLQQAGALAVIRGRLLLCLLRKWQ